MAQGDDIREVRDFAQSAGMLISLAKIALGISVSFLLVFVPIAVYGIYGAGQLGSQVKELDRRMTVVDTRTEQMQKGIDQNFKTINETLNRIETGKKKPE